MLPIQRKFIKRAIKNYGVRISPNVYWFVDDGMVFFGLEEDTEISHFISGFISGSMFVVCYSTQLENLDSIGWKSFIATYLELQTLDARN